MNVKKGVITAAGRSQRHLPLQTIADRDGRAQSVLRLLLAELESAQVEEVGIVVSPGDESLFRDAAGDGQAKVTFIAQNEPLGYGHAVLCARDFVQDEPFFLLVSDHLYVSDDPALSCAQQLVSVARDLECSVSTVQPTYESRVGSFGTAGGRLYEHHQNLYEIDRVIEKPTPTQAEQELQVPGIRRGYYLCYHGMHVLSPKLMSLLQEEFEGLRKGEMLPLSDALQRLAKQERYLAYHSNGRRYDLESRYGLLMAQLALALDGENREEVLMGIIELLAQLRK